MVDRGLAKAARGDIHDPHEGEVVLGIDQQAEVSKDILDFLAFVERHSADDLMRYLGGAEGLLQGTSERGHAAEYGDIGKPVLAVVNQAGDPGGDRFRLVAFAGRSSARPDCPRGFRS